MRKLPNAVFIAASAKDVGKTSTCTGIVSALQKAVRQLGGHKTVGYMKPLGQKLEEVKFSGMPSLYVDKDVRVFKQVLNCPGSLRDMSPVTIPQGYTELILEGRIDPEQEFDKIRKSFERISNNNYVTVIEGSGHPACGSVLGLNNPTIARRLGLPGEPIPLILVLNGGIGSTIDDFELSKEFCEHNGVEVKGVIINKVLPGKVEKVKEFTANYIQRLYHIPVLGCIPDITSVSSKSQKLKLNYNQVDRVLETAEHYEKYIDFEGLCDAVGWPTTKRALPGLPLRRSFERCQFQAEYLAHG